MIAYHLHKLYSIIGENDKTLRFSSLIIQTEVKKSSLVFTTPPYRFPCHPPLDRIFFQSHPWEISFITTLEKNIAQNFDQLECQCKSQSGTLSLLPFLRHLLPPLAVSMALNDTSARAQENAVSVNTVLSVTGVYHSQPIRNYRFVLSRYSISSAITSPSTCPNNRWHPSPSRDWTYVMSFITEYICAPWPCQDTVVGLCYSRFDFKPSQKPLLFSKNVCFWTARFNLSSHRLREKTLFVIAEFVFAVGHGGIRQWEDNALLSVFGPLLNPKHVLWVPSVGLLPEDVHSL